MIKCGKNILLHPLKVGFAKQVFTLFSHPKVVAGYDNPPIESGETAMVFTYRIIKGSNAIWRISLINQPNTLIGICAFHNYDANKKTIEIGGTLLPKYWNQNIMGTVFQHIIKYALNNFNLKKIMAKTSPTNIQAIRLISKLGFVKSKVTVNQTNLELNVDKQEIIKTTIKFLKDDKVILCPTDTIWGLSCNALIPGAIEKIDTIKNRPASKSYIVLVNDFKTLSNYAVANEEQLNALLQKRTKPTTIIYTLKNKKLQHLAQPDNTLAIRMPQKGFVADLIKQIDFPIVSTSANLSGEAAPADFSDINSTIRNAVDYIVPTIMEESNKGDSASTIIKLLKDGSHTILRE